MISITLPLYIAFISYLVPLALWYFKDWENFEEKRIRAVALGLTKKAESFESLKLIEERNLFVAFLEIIVLISGLISAVVYMMFRTIFKESFLQEEWVHAGLQYYNNLSQVDFMDWDL